MPESEDAKKISLTVGLLREALEKPAELFKSPAALASLAIGRGSSRIGTLYYPLSRSLPPSWLALFKPYLKSLPKGLVNSTTSAVLVVPRGDRRFVVTFGLGRHLLRAGVLEETFGLRVTLSSIDPGRVRSIDRRTFDAIATHTRSHSSVDASPDQFGLDIQRDLVRAVTGSPRDETLGVRMSGADSLTVRVAAELRDLPRLLDRYLERYDSNEYRKHFPWIDQIQPVKRTTDREKLDQKLVETLQESDFGHAFLAVPEPIDWAQVSGFKYSDDGALHDDVHLRDFKNALRNGGPVTLQALRSRRVRCVGKDADEVMHKWPVYACLNSELEVGKERFLLAGGRWYKVTSSFVEQINADVARVPKCALGLPDYNDGSETEYNARVAAASGGRLALMDVKKVAHGGGGSTIEFCDLYDRDRRIVHVKRYAGSRPLSHLFAQGLVSARLFLADSSFRKKVNDRLPASHQFAAPDDPPTPSEYEVVFGIVSRSAEPIPDSLPFFGKVTLASVYGQLSLYRLKVSVAKIQQAAK